MTFTRSLIAAVALSAAVPAGAETVKVAIGGSSCICYLPVVLAEQLGNFDKHGVDVELIDFKGGSAALKAVVGGSADVVSGYYEHTISMAAKKQDMQAFVVQGKLPGIALVVAPKNTGKINSIAELDGKTVGVTAPGSSTDFFLKYMLAKQGVSPKAASVVGVGVGATSVAALEQGQIDAAVTLDPAISQLQKMHPDLQLLVDTRKEADTREFFGADYVGAVLYSRREWVDAHPQEAGAMAAAIVDTLRYIHETDPAEIAAQMPANITGADKAIYAQSLASSLEMISEDGKVDEAGARVVLDVMGFNAPEIKDAGIDLSRTYTNAFVEKIAP
ncbi:ABC transporter substrate-binding protein [Paenirhodobacter sp.]|uniref:ABC transporter substrate-binding protein n=1 Tax=Paenirhodobacter sp. TaxID=1965326 RepID=UPI003B3E2A42